MDPVVEPTPAADGLTTWITFERCIDRPTRAPQPESKKRKKTEPDGAQSPERALRRSHAVLSSTGYNFRFLLRWLAGVWSALAVSNTRFEPRSRSSRKTK